MYLKKSVEAGFNAPGLLRDKKEFLYSIVDSKTAHLISYYFSIKYYDSVHFSGFCSGGGGCRGRY